MFSTSGVNFCSSWSPPEPYIWKYIHYGQIFFLQSCFLDNNPKVFTHYLLNIEASPPLPMITSYILWVIIHCWQY
jgi:hypothetical protein